MGAFQDIIWNWPEDVIQPFSSAVRRRIEPITMQEQRTPFPLVTLRFTGAMELRDTRGKETVKGKLFKAYGGDLVYSKIDVRNGSIGIVPDDIPESAWTSEYPIYEVDPTKSSADYLKLVIRSSAFRKRINSLISGASGRKRVEPSQFELLQIPLPNKKIQERIVAQWQTGQAHAKALEQQAEAVVKSNEASVLNQFNIQAKPSANQRRRFFGLSWRNFDQWAFNTIAEQLFGWHPLQYCAAPVRPLGALAQVSYGIQKSPANRPGQHARPYLRVANVRKGYIDLTEVKEINVPDSEFARFRLEKDDLLFVEGNGSRAELGRVAKWDGLIKDCVHQNHLIKVRIDQSQLLPDFAVFWFNTEAGRSHFFKAAKTSSGLGTINSHEVRTAPIPLLPMKEQHRIVETLRSTMAKANYLLAEAERVRIQTKAEVEGMILGSPSFHS